MGCQLSCRWGLWLLNKPPLVGSFGQPLNYLIVSTVIVIAIRLTGKLVENFLQQKSEEFIQEKI